MEKLMKKLNLKEALLQLDGEVIKNGDKSLVIGEALANVLVTDQESKDPLRSFLLAKKLTENKEEVELDKSELDYLKEAVTRNKTYYILITGQLLEKLS